MLKNAARRLRNAARSTALYAPPGHYYSPSTTQTDRARQADWDRAPREELPGLDLNVAGQEAFGDVVARNARTRKPRRWTEDGNNMFGQVDAGVLHALLLAGRPARIVEVGSGFTTAVMLDAADSADTTRDITCIEPYAERLRSLLLPADRIEIVEKPVQDVPMSTFTALERDDLLFIDSTHVAKPGSDVLHLYLEVLPQLTTGVLVHIHDIFWPFSYRPDWLEAGRDWTEAYLLRALLTDSDRWQVLWFSDFIWRTRPELAEQIVPGSGSERPGSIYLRRL